MGKMYMQSLGAIAHFDFMEPGAHSHEETVTVCRKIHIS